MSNAPPALETETAKVEQLIRNQQVPGSNPGNGSAQTPRDRLGRSLSPTTPHPSAARPHHEDPYSRLHEMESDPTFRDLMSRYLAEETPRKAASTQRHDQLYARIVGPPLGDVLIADVTPRRVSALHRAITAERGPVLANRIVSLVSQVCALAERDDLRPSGSNPTRAVRRNVETRKTNFLAPPLRARFLRASSDQLATRKITRSAWTLICLMLLSGLRWSDARFLRWEEVDLAQGQLRLHPRGRLRPENKGTHQRIVPLSDEAIDLLRLAPRNGPWVAPSSRTGKPYTDIRKPLGRVCAAQAYSAMHARFLPVCLAS